jgi:hypothetical protein
MHTIWEHKVRKLSSKAPQLKVDASVLNSETASERFFVLIPAGHGPIA